MQHKENPTYSEKELLILMAGGDEGAFSIVFSTHFRQMCYYAMEIVGNQQSAEDLVADTFIKLHQKKPVFENSGKLKSYLFSVLHNAAIDHVKAGLRHELAHREIEYLSATDQENMERTMVRAEVLNELHKEIGLLPAQCSQIIYKMFVDGKTVKEIAEEMGLAYQTVLNQKTRGITLLKSSLLKNSLLSPLLCWYLFSLFE